MKQLSKHELNKLPVNELKKMLPVQISADGETFAVILPMKEAVSMKSSRKVAFETPEGKLPNLRELPLSKKRQAENRLPKNF
jgi:hypothetical protein